MHGSHTDLETALESTIYPCGYHPKTKNFRPVQLSVVSEMYPYALRALHEQKGFLVYIDKDDWLTEMGTLHINMLWPLTLGEELTENTGMDNVIFPFLLDVLRRHFHRVAVETGESEEDQYKSAYIDGSG